MHNDDYWKHYWQQHVAQTSSEQPFHQVLRTLNKQAPEPKQFDALIAHLKALLQLDSQHVLLDLCCGNGLLTSALAKDCQHILGVDFCEQLITDMAKRCPANVIGINADVNTVSFKPESFDRVLFSAAIQHFSPTQTIALLSRLRHWLKPNGVLLITDIPDQQRIWNFFNSDEREANYFANELADTTIIGNWYDKQWLVKLAKFSGFSDAKVISQPDDFPYAHYRFDLLYLV